MTNFDVRKDAPAYDTITFADEAASLVSAVKLVDLGDCIAIAENDFTEYNGESYVVLAKNKEDILNLINALQKAIELGWDKE